MLKLVQVDSYYGRSHVLHGVNLEVQPGEITAILGRNGTGKTTLLKTIMGLTDRATGEIRFGDDDIAAEPTFRRARAGFAYVPQGREIIPDFTIRENILLGRVSLGPTGADRSRAWCPSCSRISPRTWIAGAACCPAGSSNSSPLRGRSPLSRRYLLLDEPTEGIQPSIVEEIEEVILRLNRVEHLTVILVEQNVEFARRAGRRFAIMEKGSVVAAGDIANLSDDLVHRHMAV